MELKINDKVGYNSSKHYFSSNFCKIHSVTKITPTGIATLDNGYRFNKYGEELKSKENDYPCGYLVELKVAESMMAREAEALRKSKTINEFKAALAQHKCGNGSYDLSEKALRRIKTLTICLNKKGE